MLINTLQNTQLCSRGSLHEIERVLSDTVHSFSLERPSTQTKGGLLLTGGNVDEFTPMTRQKANKGAVRKNENKFPPLAEDEVAVDPLSSTG